MSLTVTTQPASEPVSLAEAKAWLRVDHDVEDATISVLIKAARARVENDTRRALVTQGLTLALDCFPACRLIKLPRPPLTEITSIQYVDSAGVTQTLAAESYVADIRSTPGRVALLDGFSWPSVSRRPAAVLINYKAGYGNPSSVPATLKIAMRYLIAHWYELRGIVQVGNIINEIPMTAKDLMWAESVPEFV